MPKCAVRSLVLALTIATVLTFPQHAAAQLYFGEGTWVSDDNRVSGTWRGTIDVAGQDLSGDLIITGIPELSEAKIDGTWYPGVIDFALIQWESEVASVAGTITDDSTVSGTFVMPVPVTGTWRGQIMLVPDDFTLTPIANDPDPAANSTPTAGTDSTPTPGADGLTPEEQAFLDMIDQAAQAAPTPSDLSGEPTPTAADATATPTSAPTASVTPTPTDTPTPTVTPTLVDTPTPTPTTTPLPTHTPPTAASTPPSVPPKSGRCMPSEPHRRRRLPNV